MNDPVTTHMRSYGTRVYFSRRHYAAMRSLNFVHLRRLMRYLHEAVWLQLFAEW